MITAEEFEEWKEHPVTKEIFNDLRELEESIKKQLTDGTTIGDDAETTHGLTSRAVGHLDGIGQLLHIHYAEKEHAEKVNQDGY